MRMILLLGLGVCAWLPNQALAFDWSTGGKVTLIEVSYAPDGPLPFRIDSAAGNCPAGSTLIWNQHGSDQDAKRQSYQSALATLLTAKSTGQSITILGNNSGCTVDFLYLT